MMAQRPPLTALVQGSDGKFYGTTSGGFGTVFQITTDRALTILYAFQGGNDGAGPSGLAQGSDGDFYGTTSAGGTNNVGTVFQTSTNGGLTSLHSFTGIDGEQPSAALLRSSDGDFYGTTSGGGAHANQFGQGGTVFQISTNAVFTSLYSFTGGDDGYGPNGLAQGSDGSLWHDFQRRLELRWHGVPNQHQWAAHDPICFRHGHQCRWRGVGWRQSPSRSGAG